MHFAAPNFFWLALAAPLVALIAAWCWSRRERALRRWVRRALWRRLAPGQERGRLVWSVSLLTGVVAAAAVALAQPRWGFSEQEIERRGVDVVFVLDTSLSMATRDVEPNRLWVAQTVVRRLVEDLGGHRVALVQAEGDGVVMVPLTADVAVVDLMLDSVFPGSLPTPGTRLRAALERGLELFPEGEDKHRVMVVLSDGEDHGESLVAEALAERGVIVHAIGVGTLDGDPIELPTAGAAGRLRDGRSGDGRFKLDESGQVVVSRLVEAKLEELARETGGLYLRAGDAGVDLEPIADRIDGMEGRSYGSETIDVLEERFQWPLALAIALLALQLATGPFVAVAEADRPTAGARPPR
ncbi:MAG: VWA domain-containing protein [Acidobacteriota bacterium]